MLREAAGRLQHFQERFFNTSLVNLSPISSDIAPNITRQITRHIARQITLYITRQRVELFKELVK